jgi:hypothetical protein
MPVITDLDQVDIVWLEAALRRAGALSAGAVVSIEREGLHGTSSRKIRIRARYSEGATGERPGRLLLKLCDAQGGVSGPSEVLYYTRDYADLADAPIPRCYDAAYDDSTRRYHLLLADLGETHAPGWEREPTEAYGRALAESLAALHAHRWGADRLRAIGLDPPQPQDFERYAAHVGPGLEPLLALAAGTLNAGQAERLRTIVAQLAARQAERAQNPAGITLLHGDANPGNILAPSAGAGAVYLVDRQPFDWSLTRWLGVSDLVYAMVVWWETPVRRNLEEPVLRRYHAALRARGVTGYSWSQLYADYRFCVAEALGVAVAWCVLEQDRERMRPLWSKQLQRALAAFEDLGCAELWEAS